MSTVRRALALAGCGVLGVGLAACESTEQESAKIGRESEAAARAAAKPAVGAHGAAATHGRSHRSARGASVKAGSGANGPVAP